MTGSPRSHPPKVVIDLDGTLTEGEPSVGYEEQRPRLDVVEALRKYQAQGFQIVVFSARNMRTYEGEIGKINVHTLPGVLGWLNRNEIPFDEVILGKPWCGPGGFYVDDRAVRPEEFASLEPEALERLVSDEALQ